MRFKRSLLILFLLCAGLFVRAQVPAARKVLDDMLASIDRVRTAEFRLKQYERYEGEIFLEDDFVRLKISPLKIFLRVIEPTAGAEVLWVEGMNKGEAWVHPNGFPYFTLSLNPDSKILRKGHHNIFAIQPGYMAGIVRSTISRSGEAFNRCLVDEGEAIFDNQACSRITIDYAPFAWSEYTVRAGESLIEIASRLHLSEYMILEKNKLKSYRDVHAGQAILIPNCYARRLTLYISRKTMLPVVELIYDEQGLFERYEFTQVRINPVFPAEEFSESNPAYHFH